MHGNELLLEIADGIAIMTINRPHVLNAVSDDTGLELEEALDAVENDGGAQVIILNGQGEKAFCAGHDIGTFNAMSVLEARQSSLWNSKVMEKIHRFPKPVMAAVNGYAFGAGSEIAMACDFRIASENAHFGLPEVSLGIIPGQGGTQRLPRLIGMGPAKYYTFTGERIHAERALQLGLVEKVVPLAELMPVCKQIAAKIMANGPVAVRLAKNAINHGMDMSLAGGLMLESETFASVFATGDRVEGVNAFMEKRKAQFKMK